MRDRDYAAWGTVIGKLAALFPHLVAIEIDDFTHDVAPPYGMFSPELLANIVNNLPVFADYDADQLPRISRTVFDLLEQEEGLDALFGLIRQALPERLYETAYAMACDVSAADGHITPSEGRMLEEIRYELNIDRLHAAAIERGARARHMTL